MRFAFLCLLVTTGVAHANPNAAAVSYTVGVDGQLAVGQLVGWRSAARFELGVAPGHAVVLRAGLGEMGWKDSEEDDPTYREILSRVGYRFSSGAFFTGLELGQSWFKATYPPDEQMNHDPQWFNDFTLTALVGVKIGPARVSLDYNHDFTSPVRQVGVQLGVDIVSL
jgi:hypothetical protein